MRLLAPSLLLLSITLAGVGCEKNVQEVRRDKLDIAAPGGDSRTASAAPAAPAGAPQGIGTAQPKTPTDR